MKKGKFYVIFTILFILLIFIAGFNFIYHGPYAKQSSKIAQARQMVLETNKLTQFSEFYQYNGIDHYYIGKDDKQIYVFDMEYELIKSEKLELIDEELVKETLINKYGIEDFSGLELGYENKVFAYLCRKDVEGKLQYIYLDAKDASEIKVYELGK